MDRIVWAGWYGPRMTSRDHALRILRQRPELAELAAFPFNFDLDRAAHGEAVCLASGAGLHPVAGDDTGGTYFVCEGGAVLYADSEGAAGVIADSLDEALEMLIGLPGWQDCTTLDPNAGEAELLIQVDCAEQDIRDSYAPDLDAERTTLLTELGLRQLPQVQLIRRLHQALLRTEPDFLLLNAEEGCAYALLDRLPRPPLWESVLALGRTDLDRVRADPTVLPSIAQDEARRATMLRAAQYDRRETDLLLLRTLLEHEAQRGRTEELRLAALLVARHGQAQDHAMLRALCEADPDIRYGLNAFPDHAADMRKWAEELDTANYGDDPADEHELTWAELARRQGRTELARVTLLRLLDDAGPRDADLLYRVAYELGRLGDFGQAARAQHLYASLQDDSGKRGSAQVRLATLQRHAGNLTAAWHSLQQAVARLDGPPPPPAPATDQLAFDLALPEPEPEPGRSAVPWRSLGLGLRVAEEHLVLARAAGRAGLPEIARAALTAGTALLADLPRPSLALVELSRHTAAELGDEMPLLGEAAPGAEG